MKVTVQPHNDQLIHPGEKLVGSRSVADLPGSLGAMAPRLLGMRLGERLVAVGSVTPRQLAEALEVKRRTGGFLGETMLEMGFLTAPQLGAILEEIYGVPYEDLSASTVDPAVVALVPEKLAQQKLILPLRIEQDRLVTAMADPLDLSAADELRLISGKRIAPVVTTERELRRAFYEHFNPLAEAHNALDELRADTSYTTEARSGPETEAGVDDAPVVRLANSILHGAVANGASDIHLEPQESGLRVRYRVDGMLQEHMVVPRAQQAAVLSRIKIIGNMDIAETRRPQDGRALFRESGREFDLRISSLPTAHGEKIVLRVLDKESIKVPLEQLGFLPDQFRVYDSLIRRTYGMVLVTGPTGSGKSTTLYATLSRLNQPHLNITTIEDPIEYQLSGINQSQVNPRAGLTFPTGLRTLVRQDPDIILVGEIRDRETAEVAIQAALTGHLVFSTLHTNTAAGAIMRLTNMGIEPFLIASAVVGVVAQRLVRRVCSQCEEVYRPSVEILEELCLDPREHAALLFKRGRGCRHCSGTGYRGRTAVHEVLRMTEALRAEVLRRRSTEELDALAVREGMRPLRCSAVQKLIQGITTPEEIARVVHVRDSVDASL
jgi:type IV pilus assembly protein PilB